MTSSDRDATRPARVPDRSVHRSPALVALGLLLATAGCHHADQDETPATKAKEGKTAGIRVIHPARRDIRMTVVQPGTLQAFEVTPIYSRIAGYVQKYLYNIGDRVKAGDVLIEMWIPDVVEQDSQAAAEVKRAEVQIRVAQSNLTSAEAKLQTMIAQVAAAKAGVKRAQASYTRWESEYKRLEQLVTQRVLDEQVRDETYRQFEEAAAARDQANAIVSEAEWRATRRPPTSNAPALTSRPPRPSSPSTGRPSASPA